MSQQIRVRSAILSPVAGVALALLACLGSLTACATAKGRLFSDVQEKDEATLEKKGQDSGSTPTKPDVEKPEKGIVIVTDPAGATVAMGLEILGITPLELPELEPGSYRLTLAKDGYKSVSIWLDYDGTPLVFSTVLEERTGFVQITAVPAGSSVTVDGREIPSEGARMRVGSYELVVRAFGYDEHRERIEIREDSLTALQVTLPVAQFSLLSLDATRTTLNPANYGNLGSTRIFFRVSAPGSGELSIIDPAGAEVFRRDFPSFDDWNHEAVWDGRDADGRPLPEGTYQVELQGRGADGVAVPSRALSLRIDRSAVIVFRSLVAGAAGLLYAPSPDALPRGSMQFSALALAHAEPGNGGTAFRIPAALGLRLGLGTAEIDVEAGMYFSNVVQAGDLPLFASVAAHYAFVRPQGPLGIGAAVGARLAYHALSTDTLTNFTGLAVSAPLRLAANPVSLILTPELVASYTRVSYGPPVSPAFWLWGYLRAGLLLDVGPAMLGVSTALRLAPFSDGFGIALPLPIAAELHVTLPGTQVVLSAAVAAEIESAESYYIMAGGGFGLLQ